jgi:glyoxylase-like metal-dependent hydrolase (beta-lactamase superfamily II)/rhodanese-related sulfurtransferase
LRELDLTLRYTLETHVHADHVTGAWLLKERTASRIGVSRASGAVSPDLPLDDGDRVTFGKLSLEARATPGHTNGCLTYVTSDRKMAFTGDALLIRGAGRTDFQQGDPRLLFRSVKEKIFSLPDDCALYPGHDYKGRTMTTVREEKAHNPRLGGEASEEDFALYMENLGLPHPKQMDVAVPANLKLGKPESASTRASRPDWGPVVRSYAGVPEIGADWVFEHRGEVHVLDVRQPAELTGELGHIEGAQHIPLGELRERMREVPDDKPVVAVCRSGRRSAQAALILESGGYGRVANLTGGMIQWRARGLPASSS